MPTIIIKFPGGRYHATPWGHHVNEGQIEWPPCPWRLLRALIATGYAKLGWNEVPPAGRRLIEALAGVLPTYQLPPVSAAHSRHYMPIGELAKGVEKTTLVFDTWANVGDGELAVRWDCELDDEASELLAKLVDLLGYLGRSESWVEARVASDDLPFDEARTAVPQRSGEHLGPDWEQVPLIAPVAKDEYDSWRAARTDSISAETEASLRQQWESTGRTPKTEKTQKKKIADAVAKAMSSFPADLIDCLQKDTVWWKKQHKWSHPPGSRRVLYWRRTDSLSVSRPPARRRRQARPVEAMLLALSTPTRNKSALPHINRTLPQAELMHRSLVAWLNRQGITDCPELLGRDANRRVLKTGHKHAHIFPLDLDRDKHLDHVLICTPGFAVGGLGLGDKAQQAIRAVKRTWVKGGVGDLQVSVVGVGDLKILEEMVILRQHNAPAILAQGTRCSTWISLTPFVPPRHLKRHGRNSLEGQIQAELESRGLPAATAIDILPKKTCDLRHFVRVRGRDSKSPPADIGFSLRIELAEPVAGPLALGYASHYGLGLFEAVAGFKQKDPQKHKACKKA